MVHTLLFPPTWLCIKIISIQCKWHYLVARLFAQDVKPGKARVVKCLIEKMAQPNFGEDCKQELQQRDEIMKSDVRSVNRPLCLSASLPQI